MKTNPSAVLARLLPCLALTVSFASPLRAQGSGSLREKAIFGQDDRLDLYQVKDDRLRGYAESTVALIPKIGLTQGSGGGAYHLRHQVFGEALDLCSDERFWDQPLAADCSGFLVAPDLVATSVSCVFEPGDCQNYKFVFGFSVYSEGRNPEFFPADDVYECKEIVAQDRGYGHWALIRLDRAVAGRKPLAVNRSGSLSADAPLIGVGPDLIPTKVSGGAKVLGSPDPVVFRASLDSGNAGIPVLNQNTGLVEGIMTWFPPQFRFDQDRQCYTITRCADGDPSGTCAGVAVTKISALASSLPPLETSEQRMSVAPTDPSAFSSVTSAAAAEAARLNRQ